MYLLAFLFFWMGGNWLARNREWWGWTTQDVSDFLFYGMLGVTRVLALVENLPEDPMCRQSGVVFLTPPINLNDIIWFIRFGADPG